MSVSEHSESKLAENEFNGEWLARAYAQAISASQPRQGGVEHRDLFRSDPLAGRIEFVKRLPLNDPLLVTPEGHPTQLAEGVATYYDVSEPHSMGDCPHA